MSESGGRARIMVVDDDQDVLIVLAHYLRREGFQPIEAASGRECLRAARDHPPDLVLLDVMMPEMDGFAVAKALRNNPATAEIPVIMVTARDDISARAEGIKVGVSEFLTKPVQRQQLARRIRSQLQSAAASKKVENTLSSLERSRK